MDIYLVGGAVRDSLLDLPVAERDWVVVGATADEMLALGYTQVGRDFPVFLHPDSKEEYALARTERKTGHGYTGFNVFAGPDVTLEDDLLRRDLTINAMAETAGGELIDPYGGADDLNNGVLRHVSPAFAEDPVRILRVARFAARFAHYGFRVAHDTNALMRMMVAAGEVDYLVPERVWAELVKALGTRTPTRFFDVLHGCNALPVLFPRLVTRYAEDTAHGHDSSHLPVLAASSNLDATTEVRFAALACDMNGDGDWLDDFCTQHRVPNSYRQLAQLAIRYRKPVHTIGTLSAEDVLQVLEGLDAFRRGERLGVFLQVCEADARSNDPGLTDYPQAGQLRAALVAAGQVEVNTDGKSGKQIGEAIRQARIAAIDASL
ncbi:MAG: multifunctional CCA tRNA nucleotidyl transferase/2'3'-cyclic phosphodiesterase/2'nucleotidase/phosphatase [Gammaproteobacteria bacterium]